MTMDIAMFCIVTLNKMGLSIMALNIKTLSV